MRKCIKNEMEKPQPSFDVLTEILRKGARTLIEQAVSAEIDSYMNHYNNLVEKTVVVRNGYLPERTIQTGIGDIPVKQPRVRVRDQDIVGERFSSKILPPYLRRTKSIEEMIPWLYLKGVSTGDFQEALCAILGEGAKGLSANTITRLKGIWQKDFDQWQSRDLTNKRYVYIWADGIHFNIRLTEDERMCILVIMGATLDGTKELIGVSSGYRESEMSWHNLLTRLRKQGLTNDPELAIADGALGFWAALPKVFGKTKHQRCWVHKTANILDKLPKSQQPQAKTIIHEIYQAGSKKDALKAYDHFIEIFDAKYPKAAQCLRKDKDRLFTFFDFPAENWCHIRSTNVIESTFATVRLRTNKTKGCGNANATLLMVFKLAENAAKTWRKIRGHERLAEVIDIKWKFVDGIRKERKAA